MLIVGPAGLEPATIGRARGHVFTFHIYQRRGEILSVDTYSLMGDPAAQTNNLKNRVFHKEHAVYIFKPVLSLSQLPTVFRSIITP